MSCNYRNKEKLKNVQNGKYKHCSLSQGNPAAIFDILNDLENFVFSGLLRFFGHGPLKWTSGLNFAPQNTLNWFKKIKTFIIDVFNLFSFVVIACSMTFWIIYHDIFLDNRNFLDWDTSQGFFDLQNLNPVWYPFFINRHQKNLIILKFKVFLIHKCFRFWPMQINIGFWFYRSKNINYNKKIPFFLDDVEVKKILCSHISV